jgi:gamma-glutamyltranspeptidase/glutathione hydrolase/leukotriene-C4 hydrolase
MEEDGSVVDAAIAGLLCNSLCNAQSMGIGGGFFMLHYSRKDEKITVLDARESAPLAATTDMFNAHSKTKGGLSIAVPGELKGYATAHRLFGNTKWSRLFQPAIEMCSNGFALPASQAKFLKYCEPKILDSKPLRETFVNVISNQIYKENSIIRRPKFARTLEVIAREGESAFYNGSLTDTVLDEITASGGIITKADLLNYECLIKEPVSYKLRSNIEINSVPAPSCGNLLNFILAILDGLLLLLFTPFCFHTDPGTIGSTLYKFRKLTIFKIYMMC